MQDWRAWIAQGRTRYTRILDSKPFIDTCYLIEHRLELKYFHFAQFILNPHRAAHRRKVSFCEDWELNISDISSRSSYGWLFSNTVDDSLQRQITKKSSNPKSKLVLSMLVTVLAFEHNISFATDFAANFGYDRFRIMPDIVSKLLCAAIWSRYAVRFESEQTPFFRICQVLDLDLLLCTGFD